MLEINEQHSAVRKVHVELTVAGYVKRPDIMRWNSFEDLMYSRGKIEVTDLATQQVIYRIRTERVKKLKIKNQESEE